MPPKTAVAITYLFNEKTAVINNEVKELKKLTSHKELTKIAKGALAIVIAGTVTLSSTNAFAEETTGKAIVEQEQIPTIDLSETGALETQETPSLLPGDFFYFTKILFEELTLVLTVNDVKEAKLIADYASERLAEAEALFASGDEEAALETMKTAIEYMKNVDQIVEDQKSDEEVVESKEEVEATVADDKAIGEETTDKASEDEAGLEDVEVALSQNIIALTAAMEKVKNPVAKAALQKNIDKSYAKLANKLKKWEEKQQKKEEKKGFSEETETTEAVSEETTNDTAIETTTPIANTDVTETPDTNSSVEQSQKLESQKAIQLEKKHTQKETKQSRNEAKALAKEEKVEARKDVKEKQKENNGSNGKGN
jgi:Domain of unknown function (DUF5667)